MAGRDLRLRIQLTGIDRLSGVLGGIQGASQKAAQALRQTNETLKAQRREMRDVQRQIEAGSGNMTELLNRERALADAMEHGTREFDRRQAAVTRLATAQRRFENTQARADKLNSMGGKAIATGVVIGAGAGVGVKGAMDMEESMAGVKKVTNMAAKDVAAMSTEFLEMSTRIPMAATGLAAV